MQISSPVPSATPSAETGSGGDALFEEVALPGSDDIDSSDSVAADGFAAMIQAMMAARAPLAPIPTEVTAVSGADSDLADGTAKRAAGSPGPGEANAQFAQTLPATQAAGGATASAIESPGDGAAAVNPAARPMTMEDQVSETADRETAFVDQQDAVDLLVARENAAIEATPPDEAAGQSTDNVMLAVEQAMESFTPIPASVLALMRAGSGEQDLAAENAPITAPSTQRPLAADALPMDVDSADTLPSDIDGADSELFGASGDASTPLMPAIDFSTPRAAETDSFADVVGALGNRSGDPLSDRSGGPDFAASQVQPGASLPGSTPLGGRDHAPPIPATREAIGAFAIEQIVTRSSGRADEPVSRIEARIDPPELGRISIEISRSPEGLTAHLTVEDASVLALLDQQMKEVRQTLDAAGVPMASLTMSMGSGDDAPRQQSERDDEPLTFATPARTGRPVGTRPAGATRREIDTTA